MSAPRPGLHRRLSLRSRLALLVAIAVAVAVAACSLVAYLLTEGQLRQELDHSLQQTAAAAVGPRGGPGHAPGNALGPRDLCRAAHPPGGNSGLRPFIYTVQVVLPGGGVCDTGSKALEVTAADRAVADDQSAPIFRDGRLADGTPVRVRTEPAGDGSAVLVARPLSDVEGPLGHLAVLLVIVCAVGVLGAATVGLLVSRSALRPVHLLTAVVERIARTEDLSTPIPASGHDEIARLSRSFNAMTTALVASRDRQARLVADAGHELRTPLTSLRTNIDLLLRSHATGRRLPESDYATLLRNLRSQLLELSDLVTDLLLLAGPERPRPSERAPLDLAETVARAVERARPRAAEGRDIETHLTPWWVHGDAGALERAVVNLLDNALKFSPPSGVVRVDLTDGTLTVRDRGPGIPDSELPYVFDRFWRSPAARSMPGSGLGLSIVAQAVRESGGTVSLGPAAGGGTEARVHIPGGYRPGEHRPGGPGPGAGAAPPD